MPRISDTFRSMQQPRMMQSLKVEGGSGAWVLRSREEEEETRRHGREKRETVWSYL